MERHTHISSLQALAARWRVVGLVIVAFARVMRRYEDGRVAGAGAGVRQLQLIVRAAHILLAEDIAEQLEIAPPDGEEDQRALEYLRLVSVCLLAVHLVLEHVIARGLACAPMWQGVSAAPKPERFQAAARPILDVPILDPG